MYVDIVMQINGVLKEIEEYYVHFMNRYAIERQVHYVRQMVGLIMFELKLVYLD